LAPTVLQKHGAGMSDGPTVQLFIRTLRDTTITLQVERSAPVEWIKSRIQVKGVLHRGMAMRLRVSGGLVHQFEIHSA
jgi:hypothetical protein